MEVTIPDVIVETDITSSPIHDDRHYLEEDSSPSSQLRIDSESTSRNKSPVTVQEWVDSLPLIADYNCREECDTTVSADPNPCADVETDMFTLGAEAAHLRAHKASVCSPVSVTITNCHEPSEVDSHCSSVDSLLEARKPDPEEILLSLGFGGTASTSYFETGRVPKRFLSPSQLKGVDIEEFIRQQKDLIHTLESGFYGYRGLAGPSHSNPSVIVAKILEKLRDHEKETALVNSCHQDFRNHSPTDQNMNVMPPRRFCKVAQNVLTKIRCTPGSVLSPDNRRWLDNQGNKSPEVARRLILGQKSFTFGNNGDLIESFDGCKPDSDENLDINCESACQSVGNEVCRNELLSLSEASSKIREFEPLLTRDHSCIDSSSRLPAAVHLAEDDPNKNSSWEEPTSSSESNDHSGSFASSHNPVGYTATRRSRQRNGHIDDKSTVGSSVRRDDGVNEILSLQDEIDKSTRGELRFGVIGNLMNETGPLLSGNQSCEKLDEGDSDDGSSVNKSRLDEIQSSEITHEFSDSATESEIATQCPRTLPNKNIFKQYEEYVLLKSKIRPSGKPPDSITSEQFLSLTTEQRSLVQSRVIREALEMYLGLLKEDDINIELKNCLSNEVRKVFDLVDGSSDSSRLAVIVRQMTLLLQQQHRLSAEIRELSAAGMRTPSPCNQICDHLMKRVQDLELLVQRNAQELARMKNQLPSQK